MIWATVSTVALPYVFPLTCTTGARPHAPTHLNEESVKRTLFNKLLPGVRVITVNFNDNKDEVVDPINNILVEDTLSNALRWRNAGGIGLYFVKENPDFLNDEIADLSEITSAFGVQKVLKRI